MEKDRPTPSDVQVYAEGYLTLLLADLLPSLPLQVRKNTDDLELEQRLLLYLDAHYTEELSLESLSKEFGVSRFVLSRIFTEKLHTTFPDYVNSRRLDYARDLLLSTELSVTQIALDVGFGSSRTFSGPFIPLITPLPELTAGRKNLPDPFPYAVSTEVPLPPGYNLSRYRRSVPAPGSGTFPPSPPYPRLPLPGPPDQIPSAVFLCARSRFAGHCNDNRRCAVLPCLCRYSTAVPIRCPCGIGSGFPWDRVSIPFLPWAHRPFHPLARC